MNPQENLRCMTVNAVPICYAVYGEGKPVVLVHGNGESHHLFRTEVTQLVTAGYQVYAPDSRGHGANPPLPEYHYRDMAEDMYQFIRTLGLDHPALYGHSDGGIIALLLELHHPGTLGLMAVSGVNLSPEGIVPDLLAEMQRENQARPNPLLTLMLTEPDIPPEALEAITTPVLVTFGEHDLIIPRQIEQIARHLPHARLVIVPGADHGSYLDGSRVMGQMLLDFFETHGY